MSLRSLLLALSLSTLLALPVVADPVLDGVWIPLDPPARQAFSLVRDAAENRLVLFGGFRNDGHVVNDVWSFSLEGPASWRIEHPLGTPPSARMDLATAYDSRRRRMLVIGGFTNTDLNEVWALDLAGPMTWHQLAPVGGPPPTRSFASAVYDSLRDRVMVFGGSHGATVLNDLWELSLAGTPSWAPVTPAGGPPPPRGAASFIVDPVRDQLVLFGGNGPYLGNDLATWVLKLNGPPEWRVLTTSGPVPEGLYGQGGVYDPVGDRLVTVDDTSPYALSLGSQPAWKRLLPPSYVGPVPAWRYQNGLEYDPVHRAFVIYGGYSNTSFNDTWSFSLDNLAWTRLAPLGPALPPRSNHTANLDPATNRVIVYGGQDPFDRHDAWALHLGATPLWEELLTAGSPPVQAYAVAAACDTRRHRMLYFGGYGTNIGLTNAVVQLTLGASPTWSTVITAGIPPTPREGSTAVYDPVEDCLVVFGGLSFSPSDVTNEVWSLSLSGTPTWTQWSPGPGPTGRAWASSSYDSRRHRMLVYGGFNYSYYNQQNDIWALSLGGSPSWTEITPGGPLPPGRDHAIAVVDSTRDRLVIHGGGFSDVWALNLEGTPQWTEFHPEPPGPEPRRGSAGVFDPIDDRMVEISGGPRDFLGGSWALSWHDLPTPTVISLADYDAQPGRVTLRWEAINAALYRAEVERSTDKAGWVGLGPPRLEGTHLLVFDDLSVAPGRYWYRLVYEEGASQGSTEPVLIDVPGLAEFALAGFEPNPARSGSSISFNLPDAAPARLEVVDLRGRIVLTRQVGTLGAGRHALALSQSAPLSPGVYWVRLVRPERTLTRKGVVAR